MSAIQPKGEKLRQAVKWISECLKCDQGSQLAALIQEASKKFNLSPKEEDFLRAFYAES